MITTSEPMSMNPYRAAGAEAPRRRSGPNIVLWIVQVLLALLFLWAGGMKLLAAFVAYGRLRAPLGSRG